MKAVNARFRDPHNRSSIPPIGSGTVANKNIPDSGFPDDDGSADPRLSAALAAWAEDRTAVGPVLEALSGARLLVPVVAVLGEVEQDENGLRHEKTSDMAVPTLKAGHRTALPAFTSTESLARWDPAARPVAVPLHQALQAAAHEKADTVVLDLAGPVPYELSGSALLALAEGARRRTRSPIPPWSGRYAPPWPPSLPYSAPTWGPARRTAPSRSYWTRPRPRPRPPARSPSGSPPTRH